MAEVQQADEALAVGNPDRAAALGRAQQAGSAPVARVAAGVSAEQDDVRGDRGGVQVLFVLDRVGAESAGDDDHGGSAFELGRPLRAGRLLQARQRLGADDAKAPGRSQVVVGCPASQLEQLEDLLAAERLGAKGLMRAPGPDRGLYVHSPNIIGTRSKLFFFIHEMKKDSLATRRSDGQATRAGRSPARWRRGRCRSGPTETGLARTP